MKLLHVLPTLDPVGGGPIESVLQGGLACRRMGHRVEVATLDDPAAPFVAGFALPVHALGPGRTRYGWSSAFVPWLRAHARDYDAVVVNGLWMYHGFGTWRALRGSGVPYVVYPHGMLDPWFKHEHPVKHLRKWLYWPWADYRLLRDARAVLFTCDEERRVARESFWLYRANEAVVSFGTSAPPADEGARLRDAFLACHPNLRGCTLLLFLGRIHPKKGCDLLIDAFTRVAAGAPDLRLVMAGPDSAGWQAQLQARAAALGVAERITWTGMLRGDLKWGALRACDAFVLPSHQENFGIAVAEALGSGRPVLISDKVNIWREIAESGAGIVEPDTVSGTERALRRFIALGARERAAMGELGGALFASRFSVDAMARSLIDAVQRGASGGPRLGRPKVPADAPEPS